MKFSYQWLKELAGFKETPHALAELLTLRAFEVESVEKIGDDWAIDISGKTIGPRMANAGGHNGLAREIALLCGGAVKTKLPKVKQHPTHSIARMLSVEIESPQDCPRYTARVLTNITVGPTPAWMRERLQICGIQSINSIVDTANYTMLETGQPLHVFDFDSLAVAGATSKKILVRRARKGEKLITLDNHTYDLTSDIMVIANEEQPLAIAGIKGGKGSGVSATTKTLILESANFNPARIRAASQYLDLRTDASLRFERGLDPNATLYAINRLAEVIQEVAGGIALKVVRDIYPLKRKGTAVKFRPAYANRLIGEELTTSFYTDAFKRLGWRARRAGESFIVHPPTNRLDIVIEEDVVEEMTRILDYRHIKPKMPEVLLAPAPRNDEWYWTSRVQDALVAAGFTESFLYEFTSAKELAAFEHDTKDAVALENPTRPETAYLTPRILYQYVISALDNLRHHTDVSIFGLGKSFSIDDRGRIKEQKDLILAIGTREHQGEEEFYRLKGTLDALLESLGITDHRYIDVSADTDRHTDVFHPRRVAIIKIEDDTIGILGEIHPSILSTLAKHSHVVAAELSFDALWHHAREEAEYRPIGKYPAIIRDLAVRVPYSTKTEEVENVIEASGGSLLMDVDMFDYFQDDALREIEEKSLAFHLMFQSSERTLKDAEIDIIIKKIASALEEKGWEVRE